MTQNTGFYLEVSDTETGEKVFGGYFHQTNVRVGRDASCDVVVERSFISLQHLDVRQKSSVFEVRDLDSQNGVYVARERVATGVWVSLTNGSRFSIGPLLFLVVGEEPTQTFAVDSSRARTTVTVNGEIREARPVAERLGAAYRKLQAVRSSWEQEVLQVVAAARDQENPDIAMELLRSYPKSDWSHLHTAGDFLIEGKLHAVLVAMLRDLGPEMSVPADEQEAAQLIEHMGAVIRSMAQEIIAIERAVADEHAMLLGGDSGVSVQEGRQLLAHLFNWHRPVATGRLIRVHIATLRRMLTASITAGHALFTSISPAEIERSTRRRWPTRASVLWKAYSRLYRSKSGDGYQGLAEAFLGLFSEEFKRLEKLNGKEVLS